MVRTLHHAGIEVILDVVYNHTGEGDQMGPTLSLRGIDNPATTGSNRTTPATTWTSPGPATASTSCTWDHGPVTDSLRYWVTDMHVDGFRFDLAPVLVRGYEAGHPSAFFEIIQQDPVLSQVKLIAEPWDVGPDGYQLGRFPPVGPSGTGHFEIAFAAFGAGTRERCPSSLTAHRLERHLRAKRPAYLCQRQLHNLPRRLHAHRPGLLRAEAQ